MAVAATAGTPPTGRQLFGHPVGLYVLFFTEMWERFSYYGMRSLLVLYMVNHLFVHPEVGQQVLGFNAIKGILEHAFGPLAPQPLSSQIYGLYTAFVYLTPFFGGMLADRVLGQRKAVVLGGILMAIGHFLMAVQNLFFPALMLLILGNGAFKPNISTQVGRLYPQGDPRRDGAFTIFYMGINLGAFFSPLVCGTLGQKVGWHWGFGAAGVGMVLGLCLYLFGRRYLVIEEANDDRPPLTAARATLGIAGYIAGMVAFIGAFMSLFLMPAVMRLGLAAVVAAIVIAWLARLPRDERPRVITLFVLCALNVVFWAVYEQQGNTMQLWADQNTNWNLMGFMVPSTWYQAFNPFMIFLFAPLLSGFWAWQARRQQEPSSVVKMAFGCFLLGLSFLIMIAASQGMAPDAKRSVMWLVGSTLVITLGELYLSPIGLSFVTKIAPVRMVSMLMGVWFLANFAGNYLSGYIGTFYEKIPRASFFILLAAMGVGAGVLMFVISRPLDKAVRAHDRGEA